ncbi:hypothetical protein LEP1GSC062_3814 [Leptospira alexanderi serovar Manhao 3 str. L 60]|uniref:Sigma-70 region 2 n=1 Tax=Leptospira alexanderi serovar Manhao 3 str. L 60 TaxID=1049759 RepID=V6I8V0_9LEPT|nr:hypothetical protein LEP1GSC062_3814 [Leptospira alexanderi serovar Manhao 3 str. L 60]
MKLNQDHDFSLFYRNYKDSIYKIIRFLSSDPEEVEDIAQEVFTHGQLRLQKILTIPIEKKERRIF